MQETQRQQQITIQPLQQQQPVQRVLQTPVRNSHPLVRVIPHRILGSPPTTFNPHQTINVLSKNPNNNNNTLQQPQMHPQIITMSSSNINNNINNNNINSNSFILSLSNDSSRRLVSSNNNVLINNNNNNKINNNDLMNLNNSNNGITNPHISSNIILNNNNNLITNNLLNNNSNISNLSNSNILTTTNNNPAHVNQQQQQQFQQQYKSFNTFDSFHYVDDTNNQIIYQASDQMNQQNSLYAQQQTIYYANDSGDLPDQGTYLPKQLSVANGGSSSNGMASSSDTSGRTFIVHRQFHDSADSQLLAGSARASPATVNWLLDNYESSEGVSIPRSTNYNHYKNYILNLGMEPMNQASFGKLIRSVFPQIRTRRLGTRGNSKYHYYGIKIKSTSSLNHYDYKNSVDSSNNSFNSSQGGIYQLQQQHQQQNNNHQQQQHYTLSSPAIAATTGNFSNSTQQQQHQQQEQHSVENLSIESAQLSRDFSLQTISADGIVNLPQLASIDLCTPAFLPPGICSDHFVAYKGLYIEQCEAIIASVLKYQFNLVESLWKSFWRTDNQDLTELESSLAKEALYRIAELGEVQEYTRKCDYVFYQWLLELLIPEVLKPIESHVTQMIRTFAKHLELSLRRSMVGVCEAMVECKVSTVTAFSQSLRRYTSLNHLSQAARAVLQNASQVGQMLSDLNRVDFANIQEQAAWVCGCEGEVVRRIERELKSSLERQSSLEEWSQWLDAVVSSVLVAPTTTATASNHHQNQHQNQHNVHNHNNGNNNISNSNSCNSNVNAMNGCVSSSAACGIGSSSNNTQAVIADDPCNNVTDNNNTNNNNSSGIIISTTSHNTTDQTTSVSEASAAGKANAGSVISSAHGCDDGIVGDDNDGRGVMNGGVDNDGRDVMNGESLNDIFLDNFASDNTSNSLHDNAIATKDDDDDDDDDGEDDDDEFADNIKHLKSFINVQSNKSNNYNTSTNNYNTSTSNYNTSTNNYNTSNNNYNTSTNNYNTSTSNYNSNNEIKLYTKKAHRFLLNWSFYSSMVIRDLTLRSAASFGSFHLLRLLFDEYIFYLIEKKVSSMAKTTCIATVAHKHHAVEEEEEEAENLFCDHSIYSSNKNNTNNDFQANSFFTEDIVSVAMETVGGLDHVLSNAGQSVCINEMVECVVDCSTSGCLETKVKEEGACLGLGGGAAAVRANKYAGGDDDGDGGGNGGGNDDGDGGGNGGGDDDDEERAAGSGGVSANVVGCHNGDLFESMKDIETGKFNQCSDHMIGVQQQQQHSNQQQLLDNQQQQHSKQEQQQFNQRQQQQQLKQFSNGCNKVVVIVPTHQNNNNQAKRPKLN